MRILFYRYGSICEPAVIRAMKEYGIHITEETTEIYDKTITPGQCSKTIANLLHQTPSGEEPVSFVFSINFYPAISEICNLLSVPYVCWIVDSPVLELYTSALKNPINRIFLFDHAMYEEFHPVNPEGIFYLPLAADTACYDQVLENAASMPFFSGISFVGSLYREKSPLDSISLSSYEDGFINGLITSQLNLFGVNILRAALTDEVVTSVIEQINLTAKEGKCAPFYKAGIDTPKTQRAILADWYLGMKAAVLEREQTLNVLSEYFPVSLYTGSDTSFINENVQVLGTVKTLTEMPIIFNRSAINLNMTIRPIRSGLSLRIWDILGCGGFLMTNYQEELSSYFEIGQEIEAYQSLEELADKCAFYLEHEDERKKIALAGYEKVKQQHTYFHRIGELLRILNSSL